MFCFDFFSFSCMLLHGWWLLIRVVWGITPNLWQIQERWRSFVNLSLLSSLLVCLDFHNCIVSIICNPSVVVTLPSHQLWLYGNMAYSYCCHYYVGYCREGICGDGSHLIKFTVKFQYECYSGNHERRMLLLMLWKLLIKLFNFLTLFFPP